MAEFSAIKEDTFYDYKIDPQKGIIRRIVHKNHQDKITENALLNNNALIPTGQIAHFIHDTIPAGWLECNGEIFDNNIYVDLSNAIGKMWGNNTEFRVPDFKDHFLRCSGDTNPHGTIQDSQNKEHTHNTTIGSHTHENISVTGGEHTHQIAFTSTSDYYPEYGTDESIRNTSSVRAAPTNEATDFYDVGANFSGGAHTHEFGLNNAEIDSFNNTNFGEPQNCPKNTNLITCIKY